MERMNLGTMTTYTSEQLAALIQSVADNIIEAGIHYRLFRDLVAEIPERSTLLNQARAFWTLTFVSHRDAAIFRLCRVYDTERRAIGIQSLLRAIKNNRQLFDRAHFRERLQTNPFVDNLARRDRVPNLTQLVSDLAITAPPDPLVKRLIILRNNIFAHTSEDYAINPQRFKRELELEEAAVWELVDRALELINRYADLFFAQTYAKKIVGHDDFKSVFAALDRDWSEHQRQLLEELRANGELDIEPNHRRAAP
jgi:uncharacterized protein YeaO (DUF488 family)